MAKLELQRDHTGKLHALMNGNPVDGAVVQSITNFTDVGLGATIIVPMRDMIISEQRNVIPFLGKR